MKPVLKMENLNKPPVIDKKNKKKKKQSQKKKNMRNFVKYDYVQEQVDHMVQINVSVFLVHFFFSLKMADKLLFFFEKFRRNSETMPSYHLELVIF